MIPDEKQRTYFFSGWGKFGFSGGFGLIRPGIARYGFYSDLAGVYQRRKTKIGKRGIRCIFYITSNPQTPAQQANRMKFRDGMLAWQALTPTEKQKIIYSAKRARIAPQSYFLKQYMRS